MDCWDFGKAEFRSIDVPNLPSITCSRQVTHFTCWFLQQLGYVAIIAEDLGVITTDVNDLRKAIGAPGMVVLQFAWGSGATNTHIPHNHYENSVCYPGEPAIACCA